jgi:hypothetical protein
MAISSGVHRLRDVLEQGRRHVALAGIGQHADDVGAGRAATRDVERRGERWRRWRADEDAFARGEFARQAQGVVAGNGHDFVDQVFGDRGFRSGAG